MVRLKFFEVAGETGRNFFDTLGDPEVVSVGNSRIRLRAEMADGPLEGRTERIVWRGSFQDNPLEGSLDEISSKIDGRPFYRFNFDGPIDLADADRSYERAVREGVTVQGNSFDNYLEGDRGDDRVSGNGGNDVLRGLAGDDVLDGGSGRDRMVGGAGDDTYYQDNRRDTVVEAADRGVDLVLASVSAKLDDNVENLRVITRADVSVRGNSLDNRLEGLGGDNVLRGEGGDDLILGGSGRDRLIGGNGWDILKGGNGGDEIRGGMGRDVMRGNGGADVFEFADVGESRVVRPDLIADFKTGTDRIDLHLVDADTGTAGKQAFSFIRGADFDGNAGELRRDGDLILADVDGDGTADFAVKIRADALLTAGDFIL